MRIGTWNLAGRWSREHHQFILALDCDVLLLTEVSERVSLDGYCSHLGEGRMSPKRRWAGVFSRDPITALSDPHPASALARVGELTYCSSILPWRSCGNRAPWVGSTHGDKTAHAVEQLLNVLPRSTLVWGGDWNHALSGREYAGSIDGRAALLKAVAELGLTVPTTDLPHRLEGLLAIDHIAVGNATEVRAAERHAPSVNGRFLSDHDAYVVSTP
jgi:endonuclease/exonuclease/phosphatase family metal-dependent hydrolase